MHLKKHRHWWILLVSTTATSLFLMDTTILPVALPVIEKEIGFSQVGVIWVVNAYLLSLTMLLLIGGRLSEIFGYRILYNLGLLIFGVGSFFAAVSHSESFLLFSRSLQGVGCALNYPASIALIIAVFPPHQRARAIGIDTGIASLFMMLGPLIGGVLTEYLGWRWIFWVNLPLVFLGLVMSALLLKKVAGKKEPFHYVSALFMMCGFFCLIFGLMEGNIHGWGSPLTLIGIIFGPLFLLLFIALSLQTSHPLADFRFFKEPLFLASNLCRFYLYLLMGATILWVIYFEKQLGYTPAEVGGLIVLACLPVALMAPYAGYLADHYGHRLPMLIGFGFLNFAFLWLLTFGYTHSILIYLPGLFAFGIGMPMVMAPTMALGFSHIAETKLGSASALMMMVKQFSSTLGVAVITAIYYGVYLVTDNFLFSFIAIAAVGLFLSLIGITTTCLLVKRPVSELETRNR